jgi:mono/diheme cytochrome c family protein
MHRKLWLPGALAALYLATTFSCAATLLTLHRTRAQADDLQVGGDLLGVPKGETRYVSYSDLLKLPQESYTVSDDTNFVGTVTIGGVALEKLPRLLGASEGASMVIAVCDDDYNAHYPAAYFKAHHPLLVLRVNGLPPAQWPIGADGSAMGPYMVSHPLFASAFRVLAHADEPQVPWGVVRLEFRKEAEVYAAIEPRGAHAHDVAVQQGYRIASQNCFRCHSNAGEGGTKSLKSWQTIAAKAANDPRFFDMYVRTPKQLNPKSQMAASPQYDERTMAALRAYFTTFTEAAH